MDPGVTGRADIDPGVTGRADMDAGVSGRGDPEVEKNESEDVSLLDVVAVVPSEADETETSICVGTGTTG